MSSLLKQLSQIDLRTKCSVYGWIREAEKELTVEHIPLMLASICVVYVGKIDDEIFGIVGEGVNLGKNNKKITKSEARQGIRVYNYGIIEIPSNSNVSCEWILKMS